ncbi:hypothetical protein ACIGXM_08300 [Kitasatospora sp. NPDC052896]|uniref:divisome protein SepX/GlpR n=1 Tax=Kitasatospora sp. NPDC052896 TaxID=3364061 RepID=UPI0037C8EB90
MSSSGLIYAVIVGAWAAYLVPMWLRRQDELNESRPTERFSTAIRLLAGRSAMERRASRALGDNDPSLGDQSAAEPSTGTSPADGAVGDGTAADGPVATPDDPSTVAAPAVPTGAAAVPSGPQRRARLLARRRRMVTVLFLAFALGAITAAVAGVAFLWVPALPAILLTLYIGHLRRLERQRYEVKLDRARAAQAAQRLRERERARMAAQATVAHEPPPGLLRRPEPPTEPMSRPEAAATAPPVSPAPPAPGPASSQQALVEATDHEEWVDGLRERAPAGPDSWEPVPVPLPTYVTAPVAPRVTRGLDLGAPGTWNSGRPAEGHRTPLFDQYEDAAVADARLPRAEVYESRPRAANE